MVVEEEEEEEEEEEIKEKRMMANFVICINRVVPADSPEYPPLPPPP